MSRDRARPEWADVTAWQAREDERRARAAARDRDVVHYPADIRWDFRDFKAVLAFEAKTIRGEGKREDLIRRHFKVSPARYYQRLLQVLRLPEALEHDPVLVHRLTQQINASQRTGATS